MKLAEVFVGRNLLINGQKLCQYITVSVNLSDTRQQLLRERDRTSQKSMVWKIT